MSDDTNPTTATPRRKSTHRIVLVGGGSGGHFYPLMAIAEALSARSFGPQGEPAALYYLGPNPFDSEALRKRGITYVYCAAGKRRRYRSLRNFFDTIKTAFGVFVAFIQLFIIYPDAVMSKGGYTSVPVIIAAWLLRIPIVAHESDALPGRANVLAAKLARFVAVSYPDTAEHLPSGKVVLTGIPIRTELLTSLRPDAREHLGIDQNRPVLLVLGGSQGAERVNHLILESLDELLPIYTIVHQTGRGSIDATVAASQTLITDQGLLSHYHPVSFLPADVLNDALHVASLIISRAGSGSIYEIAVHGKPSILIPIPEEVSHDQRTNAYAYARTGAASVVEEGNLRDSLLAAEISRIMSDQEMYNQMSLAARSFATKDAGERIAKALIEITEEH